MTAEETQKGEETPEPTEEGEAPKKGKRTLLLIGGGVLALVLVGAGLVLGGVIGGGKEKPKEKPAATKTSNKPVYYELPEFIVNLDASGNRVSFLKMSVTLQLKDQASVSVIEANKPRVLDAFNTYLRELRPADIQGSAGIYRLRDELITRVNSTVEEGIVKDILFAEIIVQ